MSLPFSCTLWSVRLATFSMTSGFDTPLNSQSTTRTPSIGARLKPRRYKSALRFSRLQIADFSSGPGEHAGERDPHTKLLAADEAAQFETKTFFDGWNPRPHSCCVA